MIRHNIYVNLQLSIYHTNVIKSHVFSWPVQSDMDEIIAKAGRTALDKSEM